MIVKQTTNKDSLVYDYLIKNVRNKKDMIKCLNQGEV